MCTPVHNPVRPLPRPTHEEDLRVQQGLPDNLDHDLIHGPSRLANLVPMAIGSHAFAWGAAGVLSIGLVAPISLIGCAAAPSRTQPSAEAAIEPVSAELPPPATRRQPERVVFSDEPDPAFAEPPTDAQSLTHGMTGAGLSDGGASSASSSEEQSGLVEALAGSYEDDMKALASMQADRNRGDAPAPAFNDAPVETKLPPAKTGTADATGAAPKTEAAVVTPPNVASSPVEAPKAVTAGTTPTTAPTTAPITAPTTVPNPAPTTVTPSETTAVDPAGSNSVPPSVAPAVPTKDSLANASLELPPAAAAAPTNPAELTRLLAESLAKRGASSTEPTRDWLAYAALALGEPSLSLPTDFGSDLLPAERERIEKVHAAFAAVGRLLAQGGEIDQATAEGLVAALTGGPKLEIPKVEFCTKVESFGRFAPLGSDRFLARSNARFILYTELAGFSSELVDGEFVTRLATRVSIESERDGLEVWARQPAWTAVVDHSPTRREDFFVGEIVSVSEYLSVGSYRLKIEIRDEASGRVATASHPLHIVADPSMAAVGD